MKIPEFDPANFYVAGHYESETPRVQVLRMTREVRLAHIQSIADQVRMEVNSGSERFRYPNGRVMSFPDALAQALFIENNPLPNSSSTINR
jgi:hypothetical protein